MMGKVQKLITKAEQLAKEGVWTDAAIKMNAAILQLDKRNTGTYCRLGRCFEEKGDLVQARKAYKNALTLEPRRQGYKNAIDRIEAFIKEESDKKLVKSIVKYVEAFQVGMAAKESGDYKLAIMALEKAVSIKYSPYAATALAACYRAEGQLDKAELIYRETLSKDDSPAVRVGLAAILKDKGKLREAENILDEVLKENSNNTYVLRTQASVYSRKRQRKEAQTCFKQAFEIEAQQYINSH